MANITNFSYKCFMQFSYKMPLYVFHTMVQNSQKDRKLNSMGSCPFKAGVALPAMQWHAYKRFLAFLSGNLGLLFLRLQYILNVFKFRTFVKSSSMPIESLLTTIFFLETKSLPSIPTKCYESEPNLPEPKLLLPNAGRSNRHCLPIEKTPNGKEVAS